MLAALVFGLSAGCGATTVAPCADYPNRTCIALHIKGRGQVDQVQVGVVSGFQLAATRSPATARETPVDLPVALPVLPPAGATGNFILEVTGLLRAVPIGSRLVAGNLVEGKTLEVEAQLTPVDGGVGP